MNASVRIQLQRKLEEHGLTVVLTKDHNAMLLKLAQLSRFQRLMLTTAAGNPVVEFAVTSVVKRINSEA